MSLFNINKKEPKRVIVIGCGRVGAALATSLSEDGDTVLVIDNSNEAFRKLSPSFGGLTVMGNATSVEVLSKVQIDESTTVICATDNDNTNIMLAQMAKVMYNAQRVFARLHDPDKACVYEQQNIDTICPTSLSIKEIYGMMK